MLIESVTFIPQFPEFGSFSLAMRPEYDAHINTLPPHSDFSFPSLAIWHNLREDLHLSRLHGNVVLAHTDLFMPEAPVVHTIHGLNAIDRSIGELATFLATNDYELTLYGVPEETAHLINRSDVRVEEDRDNSDYILDVTQQIELPGKAFAKNRHKINQFSKEHADEYYTESLDLTNIDTIDLIWDTLEDWGDAMHKHQNDTEKLEAQALERTLTLAGQLGYYCLGVYIDDQIEALSFFHINRTHSTAHINHTKTPYRYRHIFDYTIHAVAQYLQTLGVAYINFEQDLGIPGLRENKLGKRPVRFLKKYNVYLESLLST